MASIAVGNTYLHRTFSYQQPQTGLNVRYFKVTTIGGSAPTEQQLINAMDAFYAAAYKPAMTSTALYVGSDIQRLDLGPPYPIQIGTNVNGGAGTGGTTPLPGQVSGIYTTGSALVGRGYRGRSYISFPDIAAAIAGPPSQMGTAYKILLQVIAAATTGIETFTVAGVAVDIQWLLRHRQPPAVAGTYTDLVAYKVGSSWATQRRRGDFGRTNPLPTP